MVYRCELGHLGHLWGWIDMSLQILIIHENISKLWDVELQPKRAGSLIIFEYFAALELNYRY